MKKTKHLFLFFAFFTSYGTLSPSCFAAPPKVSTPDLQFTPPRVEPTTLSNGVRVFALEDNELPLFEMTLRLRSSAAEEHPVGSFPLFGETWRNGGTVLNPPEKLEEELARRAASIRISAGNDAIDLHVSCLSRDREDVLALLKDLLLRPTFRKDYLELAQAQSLEELRRKNETPGAIARRAFRDVIYGPLHRYAFEATPESVRAVARKDLMAMHQRLAVADGAMIAVAGDFDRSELLKKLDQLFADWKPAGRTLAPYDFSVKSVSTSNAFFVQKEFDQSRISMGRIGISRLSAEEYALTVANYVLGGGGPSRLFGNVRSRLGLAYLIGSFFEQPTGPGLIGAGCQTRAATTTQAVQAMLEEFRRISSEPVSAAELALAKDATVNAFVFNYTSRWHIAFSQMTLAYFGFPSDYMETYVDKIRAITAGDVLRASQKYFNPAGLKIMVVGDKNQFSEPLEKAVGPVQEIPLETIR